MFDFGDAMKLDASEGRRVGPGAEWVAPRLGFMLVELLVVIAALALLSALVVPALGKARDNARAFRCHSNLSQVGQAFELYAGDHDGRIMQRFSGFDRRGIEIGYDESLVPYIAGGAVWTNAVQWFTCPNQKQIDYPHQPGYGLNWYYDNAYLHQVSAASCTILAAETKGPKNIGSHRADRDSNFPGQLDSGRHRGAACYLFFDGHVQGATWQGTIGPVDWWGKDQEISAPPPRRSFAFADFH